LFEPPLPPVDLALASPESPDVAVVSPSSPQFEFSAHAVPVLPDRAVLVALPPFASWCWVTSPPSASESLCEVVVEEALDEPDVAFPEGSPESSSPVLLVEFDAELLPCADPPEAFELLLFVALPLSETLALFEPPLPPCAVASASPELPVRADESPPELVEVALPVFPEVA
jgi:hypothetical protein